MILILALGVSALIALPVGLLAAVVLLARSLWQGRRLDRSGGVR